MKNAARAARRQKTHGVGHPETWDLPKNILRKKTKHLYKKHSGLRGEGAGTKTSVKKLLGRLRRRPVFLRRVAVPYRTGELGNLLTPN